MEVEVKYNLILADDGYWRLQAWVSKCSDGHDPNIFVHQRLPEVSNKPNDSREIFVDIANRADMEEYPAGAPSGDLSFFRKRFMDISLRDSTEMQSAVKLIERDIRLLTETYGVVA